MTRTSTRQRAAKPALTPRSRSTRTRHASPGDELESEDGVNEARSRPSRVKAAKTTRATKRSTPLSSSKRARVQKTRAESDFSEASEDDDDNDDDDDDDASLDSDALDDDPPPTGKRKRTAKNNKAKSSPKKKRKAPEDSEFSDGLEEGQEIVGVVVEAPKAGRGACAEPPSDIPRSLTV
jgi:hypothetical protein